MSSDDAFKPPRKKPSIFWWLGGAFVLLIFVFAFQLFGPSPRIVVSPQTTHITTPLGADGLPDFERHILEQMREGVTPENNAAALIWPALWPAELEPADYAAVAAELGLARVPSESEAMSSLDERLEKIVVEQSSSKDMPTAVSIPAAGSDSGTQMSLDVYRDTLASKLNEQSKTCPWTTTQHPELASWIAENQLPIDRCVEASFRGRCYFPSPTLLDGKVDPLVGTLLPGLQAVRSATNALTTRAMWHAGEQRPHEAWRDLIAMNRIGHLIEHDASIVGELVGIAICEMALQPTVTILHHCPLSPELARQIQRDLDSLPQFHRLASSMDNLQRLALLNSTIIISRGEFDAEDLGTALGKQVNFLQRFNINWNSVLNFENEWCDRYVAALKISDPAARRSSISALNDELSELAKDTPGRFAVAALNPSVRSKYVAAQLLGYLFPSLSAAALSEDRANLNLKLLRAASALAVFRSEHGIYPAKLDELVPTVITKHPIDIYGLPLIYHRMDDGYLLYSAGRNGKDDGGSNEMNYVLEGQPYDSQDETATAVANAKMPKDADDFAIRVPQPTVQLPKPPSTTEQ